MHRRLASLLVTTGLGRLLFKLDTLSLPSSATEVKAVMGTALFSKGIIRRPSLAHSDSFSPLPHMLRIMGFFYTRASNFQGFKIVVPCSNGVEQFIVDGSPNLCFMSLNWNV